MRVLKPFDYFEPETVEEASELLSIHGGKARVLAGGVDLIPRMRKGKTSADRLVNIQKLPGMDLFEADETKGLKFGAMVRLRSLETSRVVRDKYPALYQAIHQISSLQAKTMGTAVGNLCVATPASDVATTLLALGAKLTIAGGGSTREEPMESFYPEYGRTSLKKGQLVTAVTLPASTPGTGTAFLNLVRTCGDIAKVSVAVSVTMNDGVCMEARIAVGAVAPVVFRAVKAEAMLKGKKMDIGLIQEAAKAAAGATTPITDLRSTADYRREMTGVLVRRALEKALDTLKA
ncbi:MAG: xanthine dehydrogenase family protein subunit M [Pseudomonadota bacterium]